MWAVMFGSGGAAIKLVFSLFLECSPNQVLTHAARAARRALVRAIWSVLYLRIVRSQDRIRLHGACHTDCLIRQVDQVGTSDEFQIEEAVISSSSGECADDGMH